LGNKQGRRKKGNLEKKNKGVEKKKGGGRLVVGKKFTMLKGKKRLLSPTEKIGRKERRLAAQRLHLYATKGVLSFWGRTGEHPSEGVLLRENL